jgi:hypothetical protein
MTLAHRLIYVVDDDLSMRKAIGRLLESQDYSGLFCRDVYGDSEVPGAGSPSRPLLCHSRFEHAGTKWP